VVKSTSLQVLLDYFFHHRPIKIIILGVVFKVRLEGLDHLVHYELDFYSQELMRLRHLALDSDDFVVEYNHFLVKEGLLQHAFENAFDNSLSVERSLVFKYVGFKNERLSGVILHSFFKRHSYETDFLPNNKEDQHSAQ
jgi:hypothetical protein